ncbi:N-acetylmuramoyl-L-alanine amidase [Kistimonas asteriae]|uniref:N-acetylmuramoyl-L-alanine amidase n=1 Tax=Kistimonas asteriae TaxID=517724 RepID=UPI001BA484F5|nr:N-acetylmuramoyl-L-alanine amidase [Kistimonas asteriae]
MSFPMQQVECPNQDRQIIPVEFLVLHYTATDLSNTLAIFQDDQRGVSSHMVIDVDGMVYSLVDCLQGQAYRAWHAGRSIYVDDEKAWSGFNDFSLGIELVNTNGNIFPFTDAQYQSLAAVVLLLKQHYPSLMSPSRILGHEHIAGYRGKVDPGYCFDWDRFWPMCYPDAQTPERQSVCPEALRVKASAMAAFSPDDPHENAQFWMHISALMEAAVELAQMDQP